MADTPLKIRNLYPGLELTYDAFPEDSDTAALSDQSLSELSNDKGTYEDTISSAVTGIHTLNIKSNGTTIAKYEVDLQDTTDTCDAVEIGQARANLEAAYSDGFIYLDLTSGVSGTRRGKNGTKTNPSNSWANTSTLMSLTGLRKVFATRASAGIQLTADSNYVVFDGSKYTFDPNSYSLRGSIIRQGVIDSKNFGDTNTMLVEECLVTGATFTSTSNECTFQKCQLRDTLVLKNGKFNFENCTDGEGSALADAQSPELDYNSVGSSIRVRMANWSGEISVSNMGDSLNHLYIYGNGILTLNATCSDGTIVHSSGIEIVDNSGGFSGTITLVDNRVDIVKVNGESDAAVNMQYLNSAAVVLNVDDSTFTPTSTAFETDGAITADDTLIGMAGTWFNSSGSPANTGTYFIEDSEGTTTNSNNKLKITTESMPAAPADGDVFVVLGAKVR